MSGAIERKEHVVQYKILGGTFPVVTCNLADGESMITESGAMVWMTPNMEMQTSAGGLGAAGLARCFQRPSRAKACFKTSGPRTVAP